ncbi:MAG: hypothetical protein DLM58_14190 [Pseudonocardiales bacterium]|nr:MAG: hypothetical protein DLM58_14190 [Pseudonocardiales bacterium]
MHPWMAARPPKTSFTAAARAFAPSITTSADLGGQPAALARAAVVVEDRYSQVFKLDRIRPAVVADGHSAWFSALECGGVVDSECVCRVNFAVDLCGPGEVGGQVRRADLLVGNVRAGEEVEAHAAGCPWCHCVVQPAERRAQWCDLFGVGDSAAGVQGRTGRLVGSAR